MVRNQNLSLLQGAAVRYQTRDKVTVVVMLKLAAQEDGISRAKQYMDSDPETLQELMSKDLALLEGDMVLSSDRNAVNNRWPTKKIPYAISSDLGKEPSRRRRLMLDGVAASQSLCFPVGRTDDILVALAMVSKHTCVTFHQRTTEADYLFFKPSTGCASFVGFRGGKQPVFVAPPCIVGNIVHEVLHALGFHHEHTRTDRERYITILSKNIMPGMESNFKKYSGQTFDLPYDTTSIMHYGSGFFSSNGLPTIVANDDVKGMGQRAKMTENDIQRVRKLYDCDSLKHETEGEAKQHDDGNPNMASDLGAANRTEPSDVSGPAVTVTPAASLQQLNSTSRRRSNTTEPL
ncbi:low choriolytic enzyme-like [Stegastes partitus]|uniref:Metalloendopeptidase n=1 Tax=Stegastes partitus TaxID=144197 RepID=A0A9Y4NJI4_9TELE|nr:PREDICTED: low choriolytic enzyme-like [Stegastes partitus]